MSPTANLARLLEAFFTDRLIRQRQASPHTIAAYRDAFRLLLGFARQRLEGAVRARIGGPRSTRHWRLPR